MVNQKESKITFVLVYAASEMMLIILLFMNGFFSYFIAKFADYFRLKRPCLWCSRIDCFFEPAKSDCFCSRSLFCEAHSMEISKLGYCLGHKKLAESQFMCGECFTSCKRAELAPDDRFEFPWSCSCCGASLDSKMFFPDHLLINGDLTDSAKHSDIVSHSDEFEVVERDHVVEGDIEIDKNREEWVERRLFVNPNPHHSSDEEIFRASTKRHLEFLIDTKDCHLILVELNKSDAAEELPNMRNDNDDEDLVFEFDENVETACELMSRDEADGEEEMEIASAEPRDVPCDDDVVSMKGGIVTEINELTASNEVEDEFPDTPTSADSFHQIHKKLLMLERRDSCAEEEGSVTSDIETGDTATTIEKLKSALRTERRALQSLYAELEEERNASAVAANQTMAMINRLQEEKAAMQMEALHYQRMMDEQTEYDQEALHLLHELITKTEHEKEELERQLSFYRTKVENHEAGESCSNSEEDEAFDTPPDADLYWYSFESERLSILEQLKRLERRLFDKKRNCKGRILLPLFDAADIEEQNGHAEVEDESNSEFRWAGIEEEVENVYERLHAMEADGEFLKHCIISLRKGGNAAELLREILQHLRDLRLCY